MVFRDENLRSLCDDHTSYDRAIEWVRENNPYCKAKPSTSDREDFAVSVVHSCIRGLVYADSGMWYSTGMLIAVRVSSNPDLPGYKKVILTAEM